MKKKINKEVTRSQEEEEWLDFKSSGFTFGRGCPNASLSLHVQQVASGHSRSQMISHIPKGKGNWRRSLSPRAAFSICRQWNQDLPAPDFPGHLLEAQACSPVPIHHPDPWKCQGKGFEACNKERGKQLQLMHPWGKKCAGGICLKYFRVPLIFLFFVSQWRVLSGSHKQPHFI